MSMKSAGGIKLTEYKNTKKLPISSLVSPDTVSVELKNSLSPCVASGETVKRYQLIAENDDGFSAYASVSGRVIEVSSKYIVIKNDMENSVMSESDFRPHDISELTAETLAEYCKHYGICGTFSGVPVYEKILKSYGKSERIIINCMESDPSSGHVRALIREKSKSLVFGAKIIMYALGVKKCVYAVGAKDKEAKYAIQENFSVDTHGVFAEIKEKYPAANERLLLNAIYKTELSCDKETYELGYPVFSAETVINVFECLRDGRPVVDKVISVSGYSVEEPKNFRVPVGTHIGYIMENITLRSGIESAIAINGTLNGYLANEYTPITYSTNTVTFLKDKNYRLGICIKCAKCATFCPMHLVPYKLYENYKSDLHEENVKMGLYNCIECGICSFVCAGKVDLLGGIRNDKYYSLTPEEAEEGTMIFESLNDGNESADEPEEIEEIEEIQDIQDNENVEEIREEEIEEENIEETEINEETTENTDESGEEES